MIARRTAIVSCSPDAASPAVTTVIDTAEGIVAAFDVTGEPTGNAYWSPARPYPRCERLRERHCSSAHVTKIIDLPQLART